MRNKHSKVSDPDSFVTSSGSKFHTLFAPRFRDDGTIELRPNGRKDIKAEINSHAAECDMSIILAKLRAGDASVLNSKKPMFGDFTVFPKTYVEILDLVNRSEDAFNSLPLDVRSKFDNDVNKWFAKVGSPEWLTLMGLDATESLNPDVSVEEVE